MAESLSTLSPGHNGTSPLGDATQELMFEFLERHETIVEQRKALTKLKRELEAEVEKAGIPKEAWLHFLRTREQAGVIRERIDAAWRQLHAWDLKPVGLQSQIDTTTGVDQQPNVHELKRVDGAGFDAGQGGTKREANPYTPGTEAYVRWDTAWLRGFAENPNAKPAAENGEVRRGRGRPPGTGKHQRAAREAAEAAAKGGGAGGDGNPPTTH